MSPQLRRDLVVIAFSLLLASMAFLQAKNLEITSDNRVFYHSENPRFVDLKATEHNFELYSNITFLIISKEILKPETAQALGWLSHTIEGFEGYIRHSSLDNYPHLEVKGDEIEVTTILEAACPDLKECQNLSDLSVFPEIKFLSNRLLSDDEKAFATSVAIDIKVGDTLALNRLTEQIEHAVTEFNQEYPDLQLVHTGAIPMMQAFADASNQDLGKLFPISVLLIFSVSCILFGSIRFALAALTCSILNILLIMGIARLFGLSINSATSTLPLALLVISISSAAHLICYVSLRLGDSGQASFRELVTQSTKANSTPILMASLTTCVGLATLSFVDIPPFKEFGLLAALGTISNYFLTISLLPAILRLFPLRKQIERPSAFYRLINSYARFVDNDKLPVRWVIIGAMIASLGLAKFSIDEDYVKYFDRSHDFRIGADLLSENLASPYSIDLSVDFEAEGAALNPKNVKLIEELQIEVEKDPLVVSTFSLVQHLKIAVGALGDKETEDEESYLQQVFLAYELSLPPGQTTNVFIDPNHQTLRVSVLLGKASSAKLLALEQRIKEAWKGLVLTEDSKLKLLITGETLPLAHLSKEAIVQVLASIVTCLALLWVGILSSTKSLLLANIGIGAVIGPLTISFGSWAWVDSEFGLATAIVIAVTIGIIIDDAIHFLHRYRIGRTTHDLSTDASISYAIHHSAAGIISSSLILVSGFLVLCNSSFAVNQQFGIGVSLTIASALVLTLVVLPALLITFRPRLN